MLPLSYSVVACDRNIKHVHGQEKFNAVQFCCMRFFVAHAACVRQNLIIVYNLHHITLYVATIVVGF